MLPAFNEPASNSVVVPDIVESSNPAIPKPDLLEYSDVRSEDAAMKEGGLLEGLEDREDVDDEDEAVEVLEESEGKTDPSTLLAPSREASFSNSTQNREGFFSFGG